MSNWQNMKLIHISQFMQNLTPYVTLRGRPSESRRKREGREDEELSKPPSCIKFRKSYPHILSYPQGPDLTEQQEWADIKIAQEYILRAIDILSYYEKQDTETEAVAKESQEIGRRSQKRKSILVIKKVLTV